MRVEAPAIPGEKFPHWAGSPTDGKLCHPEVMEGFLALFIVGPENKQAFWNEVARLKQERETPPETTQ